MTHVVRLPFPSFPTIPSSPLAATVWMNRQVETTRIKRTDIMLCVGLSVWPPIAWIRRLPLGVITGLVGRELDWVGTLVGTQIPHSRSSLVALSS